jgi:hypothetical protein
MFVNDLHCEYTPPPSPSEETGPPFLVGNRRQHQSPDRSGIARHDRHLALLPSYGRTVDVGQ